MQSVLHKAFKEYIDNQSIDSIVHPKKLLDIDSTHRNRNLFPNPSTFEVPMYFGPSGNTSWNSKDIVSFEIPVNVNLTLGASGPSTNIVLSSSSSATGSTINNVFNNMFLELNCTSAAPTFYKILSYDGATKIAVLDSSITTLGGEVYNVRPTGPTDRNTVQAGPLTLSRTVVNLNTPYTTNQRYVGAYLRMASGVALGSYALIASATGTSVILSNGLSAVPAAGDYYEICSYGADNFSPLLYNGTSTLNQQVCYNVAFLGLTIPNVLLANGYRSTIMNYPYVYIRLYNLNPRTGGSNIYSNNPGSELACFKVILYTGRADTNFLVYVVPELQTIALKIDQSLFFAVTLPDGQPLVFQEADWVSACVPNPLLQVSATFQIERLTP